jgi:hypothetical protein
VRELGPNAYGEPSTRAGPPTATSPSLFPPGTGRGGCWWSPRVGCCTRPSASLLYELATGHPDRAPGELVFPTDLASELRAWPPATAAPLITELARVGAAVVWCWQRGDLLGLELPLEAGEDARVLNRPAMTLARAALRARLGRQVARARCRWRHPSSGRRAGEPFL